MRSETGTAELTPDPQHRLPGRGAWLHPSAACLEQAVRRKAFSRALRLQGKEGAADSTGVADHLHRLEQRLQHHGVEVEHTG